MAASAIAPMAMAMPPRDMMLAVIPIAFKGMKAIRTAMGIVMIGIKELGGCQRKMKMTSDTVMMISVRVDFTVLMALRMRSERS